MPQNKDLFASNWTALKDKIKAKWNKLTDADLNQINGQKELLINKLQKVYGLDRTEASSQLEALESSKGNRQEGHATQGREQAAANRGAQEQKNRGQQERTAQTQGSKGRDQQAARGRNEPTQNKSREALPHQGASRFEQNEEGSEQEQEQAGGFKRR